MSPDIDIQYCILFAHTLSSKLTFLASQSW